MSTRRSFTDLELNLSVRRDFGSHMREQLKAHPVPPHTKEHIPSSISMILLMEEVLSRSPPYDELSPGISSSLCRLCSETQQTS